MKSRCSKWLIFFRRVAIGWVSPNRAPPLSTKGLPLAAWSESGNGLAGLRFVCARCPPSLSSPRAIPLGRLRWP